MYSDIDSDSEEAATKSYLRISSRPYLRLYDKDEAEARAHELWGQVREKAGPPPSVADRSFSKVYRILRFFKSYEGFYTGYLDLTGRHMPRFLSLHSRWNSYLADFLPITLDAKQITVTAESYRDLQLYTDYEFPNTTRWDAFRKKWRIPATAFMDYSALLMHTTKILRTIGVNPSPRIQKLCLADLPPELLDTIFRHTDMHEARLLSYASKKLNEIGRRYIFESRTLSFNLSPNFWRDIEDMDDPLPYLERLARSERTKILATTGFLLSRLDLCQKMKTVCMENHWEPSAFERTSAEGFELSQVEEKFFVPIHRQFMNIFAASSNLVQVSLRSLKLTTHVIQSLSKLRFLHTLRLQECYLTASVQSESHSNDLKLPIYNLRLLISPQTLSMWQILPLCPNLRTLSVLSPLTGTFMPSAQIWSRCSFLPHLERLCLNHIHPQPTSVDSLANALRAVANTSGLHLTHFKLHTRRGITDAGVHILLDSIQGAPLKVLVLEGLAEAEPPLLERIAEIYEQTLVALTLVRRASDRQLRNQPVIWPHPAWEYAPHLSRLTSLKHFGWNSACDYLTIGTSVLHTFEQNFPVDPYGYPVAGEDDYIESLGLDALPFAAHCPSLETFTSHENFTLATLISRTSAGSILAKPFDRAEHSIHDRYDIRQWNPSTMFGHAWPHIIPISTDTEPNDA